MEQATDSRVDLLRKVDGIPHVVLGPLLLATLASLERATGASRGILVAFLVPFTAYGAAVVVATRGPDASPPRWLMPVAVTANAGAAAIGSVAAARPDLTPLGRLAGGGLAGGGLRMLLALRASPR